MKKLILMAIAILYTAIAAAQSFTQDNITYQVIPDTQTVTVFGADEFIVQLTIPATVTDNDITYTVTTISVAAFEDHDLTSVTIPNSITSIGINAFSTTTLKQIIAQGTTPPIIPTVIGSEDTLGRRRFINLVVPSNTAQAYAEAGWTEFRFVFEEIEENPNTLTVTNQSNATGDLDIPPTLTHNDITYTVTTIGDFAFEENDLTSVVIPNSITSIGIGAFNDSLKQIIAQGVNPPTITTGTNDTFGDRSTIDLVVPPNTAQAYAEAGWTGFRIFYEEIDTGSNTLTVTNQSNATGDLGIPPTLTHNDITYTVTTIGDFAFKENDLTSVVIPGSVTSIGAGAFKGNQLTQIIAQGTTTIPTITEEGTANDSFDDRDIIDLVVPPGTAQAYTDAGWTGFRFVFEEIDTDSNTLTVTKQSNVTGDVVIPETLTHNDITYPVTAIGPSAFFANSLTSITIPGSVTAIGVNAFSNNELTQVFAQGVNPPTIPINGGIREIFDDPSTINIIVPPSTPDTPGTAQAYAEAGWTEFRFVFEEIDTDSNTLIITRPSVATGDLIIPSTLTHNDITYTVTQIGERAFNNNGLSSVIIPNTVTTIGKRAFLKSGLTSITIPNSVTTIGRLAFFNNKLTSITIPASVTTIGHGAFNTLYNDILTKVIAQPTTPPTITIGGDNDPFGNRSTIDLQIPIGTKEIYEQAGWIDFRNTNILFTRDNITYKILPDTDTTTNTVAIIDNTNTGSISIPENVTNDDIQYTVTQIEANAFATNSLTSIIIPGSVTSIGSDAFTGNPLLTQIIAQGVNPPTITTGTNDTFDDRSTIDIVVPPSTPDTPGTAQAYAEAGWTEFRFVFEEIDTDSNTLIITRPSNTKGDVTIPSTLNHNDITYTVTQIGERAFNNNGLSSVIIPNTVTTIGKRAFLKSGLTSITIPNSVTTIGRLAFFNNKLTSITIPASVTTIGHGAFNTLYNDILTKVIAQPTTPPTITIGGDNDPFGNRSTIDLQIPIGTKEIYEQANWIDFRNTTETLFTRDNITYKILPDTDTTNTVAIIDNTNTGSISIPQNVTNDDIQYTVTQIEANAFATNSLTSITIPGSVTSIGPDAFTGNPLLTQIIAQGVNPPTITTGIEDEDIFDDRSTIDLVVPPNTAQAYADKSWTGFRIFYQEIDTGSNTLIITKQSNAIGDLTIPATLTHNDITYTVTQIGAEAFSSNKLTSVIIPNSVTTIGDLAFKDNDLTSITIPNSVTTIGDFAFQDSGITSITFNEGLITIGSAAFSLNKLTEVEIPDSVTTIGDFVFTQNQLTSVTIPSSVTTIGVRAFSLNKLTEVEIPDSVTTIGDRTFEDNELARVTIPASVTTIGDKAFENNPLTLVIAQGIDAPTITTGENDTFGDRSAIDLLIPPGTEQAYIDKQWIDFKTTTDPLLFTLDNITYKVLPDTDTVTIIDNTNTGSISIPENVTNDGIQYTVTQIDANAFNNNQITNITLPNTILTIGDNAFANNDLTSITIPGKVTTIGRDAFSNTPLTQVIAQGVNPPAIITTETNDGDTFDNRNTIDLFVPPGTQEAYQANGWTGFKSIEEISLLPVITLEGALEITIELGGTFTDPGAKAVDNSGVDITDIIDIDNPVDTALVGTYTITYNVTDAAGNKADPVNRTVSVVDTTPPVITLNGDTPQTIPLDGDYTELGATVTDLSAGDIEPVIDSSDVDTSVAGSYTVTYNATDAAGNTAVQVDRTVNVVDITPPVITLLGDNLQRIELGGDYTELGATALDNVDGDLTNSLTIDSSTVDTSVLGDYLVTYTVTDAANNTATLTRTVQVVQETTLPVITLLGDQQITLELGDTFTDPGATALDNNDGDITNIIDIDNPVDTAVVGTYTITYNVTDASGNPAIPVDRTVNVVDTTPPVITLNGDNPQRIQIGVDYIELGATVTDLSANNIEPVINSSAVNTSVVGSYTVTYNATDASGNLAIPVDRTVLVLEDATPPVITLIGDQQITIELGDTFTDPGATALDNKDGDITSNINTDNPVDTAVVGTYIITYTVTDAAGNAAVEVTRTVQVVDSCPIANLDPDHFTLQSLAETCSGKNNGAIRINAKTELDYTLTINEQQLPFTSEILIADLAPATYPICITVDGFSNCQQCFEVVINPGINIAGTTAIQQQAFGNTKLQVAIQTGTPPYTVYVNGLQKTVSQNKNFSIPVANGDQVEVSSALECQGKLTTKVQLEDELQLYPNPTQGDVTLTLGTTALKNIAVVIYNPLGIAVSKAKLSVANRQVIIPMSTLPKGAYILQLPEIGRTFKVIKN